LIKEGAKKGNSIALQFSPERSREIIEPTAAFDASEDLDLRHHQQRSTAHKCCGEACAVCIRIGWQVTDDKAWAAVAVRNLRETLGYPSVAFLGLAGRGSFAIKCFGHSVQEFSETAGALRARQNCPAVG
jgi:hypothetical protein